MMCGERLHSSISGLPIPIPIQPSQLGPFSQVLMAAAWIPMQYTIFLVLIHPEVPTLVASRPELDFEER